MRGPLNHSHRPLHPALGVQPVEAQRQPHVPGAAGAVPVPAGACQLPALAAPAPAAPVLLRQLLQGPHAVGGAPHRGCARVPHPRYGGRRGLGAARLLLNDEPVSSAADPAAPGGAWGRLP